MAINVQPLSRLPRKFDQSKAATKFRELRNDARIVYFLLFRSTAGCVQNSLWDELENQVELEKAETSIHFWKCMTLVVLMC